MLFGLETIQVDFTLRMRGATFLLVWMDRRIAKSADVQIAVPARAYRYGFALY